MMLRALDLKHLRFTRDDRPALRIAVSETVTPERRQVDEQTNDRQFSSRNSETETDNSTDPPQVPTGQMQGRKIAQIDWDRSESQPEQ
jgi:hypothetical protein